MIVTVEPGTAFDPACSVNKNMGIVVSSLDSEVVQEDRNNEMTVCFYHFVQANILHLNKVIYFQTCYTLQLDTF